ncbi:glycosyltransferase family 39 protein [Shewanella sp. VB17]|uniref:ArnT family glycosyltransferase n=1 Tax=Shewanella sp. VB17 TaxID=2739432 RepID=UPI001563A645|nr:glycosyltransferase family 39 protein [Shewanella sp. VB17]NRD75516.1 glycosyltransferase family 39 protein [Shewanella sp. VB17]
MIRHVKSLSLTHHSLIVLLFVLCARLISLGLYPLMDTTEARYGEMARLMVETGNWLTPLFDYGTPFWGKPPLHTWMSALGIELFGLSEFAVRSPHWLAAIAVLFLLGYFAKQMKISAIQLAILLATTSVFYVSAGAVMTDMALTLGMTLAMVGFYLCWQGRYAWGYLGFVGLAIGLLAKGPVVLVLMGLAVGPWLIWQYGLVKPWKQLYLRVPLLSGTVLLLLLSLPWFFMAEQATPGFLQYFIIGEHWLRFVDSGWQGDLYGSAHDEVRGTIWLFFIVSALPWSLFIPRALWRLWQVTPGFDKQTKFFICWMLSPLILFTFAGNILPAYVLPGIPGMGLLLAYGWRDERIPQLEVIGLCVSVLMLVAVVVLNLGPVKQKSDKWLLAQRMNHIATYYWRENRFSSRFYSQGKAAVLKTEDELTKVSDAPFYLVVKTENLNDLKMFSTCAMTKKVTDKRLLLCGT